VPVSLNRLVLGMEPLIRQLAGADVEVDLSLAGGAGQVLVDPAQMEHVIVNLVLSACDAMPAGGRLAIETADRRISGAAPGRSVRPGRYVMLALANTGGDDNAPRDVLGRSILFGIVRQYGGVVRVASEAGQGTVLKVYLPRLEEAESEPEAMSLSRGAETVLVAEDEDGVRELTRKVLAGLGYTVLTARHGREALLTAANHGGAVDLLVTDVVMAEMNGRELAEQLRLARPGLKVLFMSGYADDEVLRRGISEREMAFLRKPFAAEELAHRVRGLLDGG
jgi:CheY-like chemotaxis protein